MTANNAREQRIGTNSYPGSACTGAVGSDRPQTAHVAASDVALTASDPAKTTAASAADLATPAEALPRFAAGDARDESHREGLLQFNLLDAVHRFCRDGIDVRGTYSGVYIRIGLLDNAFNHSPILAGVVLFIRGFRNLLFAFRLEVGKDFGVLSDCMNLIHLFDRFFPGGNDAVHGAHIAD